MGITARRKATVFSDNHNALPGKKCKRPRQRPQYKYCDDDMSLDLPTQNSTFGRPSRHLPTEEKRPRRFNIGGTSVPPKILLLFVFGLMMILRLSIETRKLVRLQSANFSKSTKRTSFITFDAHHIGQDFLPGPNHILQPSSHPDFGGLRLFSSKQRPSQSDRSSLLKPRKIRDRQSPDATFDLQSELDDFDANFEPKYAPDEDFSLEDDSGRDSSPVDGCRRTATHQLQFSTCNSFHELNFAESIPKYLGQGDFRKAAVFAHEVGPNVENIVLKHIHIGGFQEHKKEQGNYEKMYRDLHWMRTDALVADRLHGSPRTYDVYGYCGLSMFSEYFRHGTIEDVLFPEDYDRGSDDESESEDICAPANALKPRQKLQLALNLAEAVADLHGYSGGKIVHQDLTPSQFLWNDDRTLIKLNDFNRAEIMLWNDAKEQYCDYSQPDIRFNRSPEEAWRSTLQNEKVDVFNLSPILFAALTGRWTSDNDVNKMRSKYGGKLAIPECYRKRSPEEAALVDIINRCREHKASDRPSIFEVIKQLRKVQKGLVRQS